MRKLRAAIIGTSSIAHVHAAAVNASSHIELVSCWNRIEDEGLGRNFGAKHGVPYYSVLDKMLEDERPDIAINALPPLYHAMGLEKASGLGACLVVEKPMAVDLEACRRIIAVAKKNKVALSISESSGFDRTLRAFQKNRERFGSVLHMVVTNYRHYFSPGRSAWITDPEQCPGGMILNVGVHKIAAMRIMAGSLEKSITARVGSLPPEIPVPGDCSIRIEYENGADGTLLMCGYHERGETDPNVNRVVTDKGLVHFDNGNVVFVRKNGETEIIRPDGNLSELRYTNFYRELESALLSQAPSPYSEYEGMRDVAVVQAAVLSSKEGRTVKMEELLQQ